MRVDSLKGVRRRSQAVLETDKTEPKEFWSQRGREGQGHTRSRDKRRFPKNLRSGSMTSESDQHHLNHRVVKEHYE